MNADDLSQEDETIYVNITIPIDQAWQIVDALRLRGMHNIAREIIDAINEAANQLESD